MRVVFVGRRRIVWQRLLLYLATLGISRRIWLYRVFKEVDGHEALEWNHKLNVALLWLPIIGPMIVQAKLSGAASVMMHDSEVKFSDKWFWLSFVPILGNLTYIGVLQSKLNRFWDHQLAHPEQGVEIDFDLHSDPSFVVELQEAIPESYKAGSRFDRKKRARQEKWRARLDQYKGVGDLRLQMREAGGSTSIFPWVAPKSLPMVGLSLTCGRCSHKFEAIRNPYAETPVLCPDCGLHEVLPALRSNPLAQVERAAVKTLEVDCPNCERHFHALQAVEGPTTLSCPDCDHKEVVAITA